MRVPEIFPYKYKIVYEVVNMYIPLYFLWKILIMVACVSYTLFERWLLIIRKQKYVLHLVISAEVQLSVINSAIFAVSVLLVLFQMVKR